MGDRGVVDVRRLIAQPSLVAKRPRDAGVTPTRRFHLRARFCVCVCERANSGLGRLGEGNEEGERDGKEKKGKWKTK